MSAQYNHDISQLMVGNAQLNGELEFHFDINQYANLVTEELFEAGLHYIQAVIEPMLAEEVSSEAHLKICIKTATSLRILRYMSFSYRTLLTLIALDHSALHKSFDIKRIWEPILLGVGEVACPVFEESPEESAKHANNSVLTKVATYANIGPPPSIPLPPLPAVSNPGSSLRLPIPPRGSCSTPVHRKADTDYILLPSLDLSPFGFEVDNTLDRIKAPLSDAFLSETEVEESLLQDQESSLDSDAIDSSLLVSWSDLGGPPEPPEVHSPARSPSPAVHSSEFVEAYLLLGQQTWPNYQFAASDSDNLSAAALPSSTASTPFIPGAWKLRAPKTPARRSSAYIPHSSPLRLKRAAEDLPPSSPPIASSSAPRPKRAAEDQLSSPDSTTSFYTAYSIVNATPIVRTKKIKQAGHRAPTLEPPRPVQPGIYKIQRNFSSRAAGHRNLDA